MCNGDVRVIEHHANLSEVLDFVDPFVMDVFNHSVHFTSLADDFDVLHQYDAFVYAKPCFV